MSNEWIATLGIIFIFVMTTLGSALVFLFKKDMNQKVNSLILGFAAGIMIAASVWGLLVPSFDASESYGSFSWVPPVVGFILGGLFLVLLDKIVPHFHSGQNLEEGPSAQLKKSTKLFLAVTIHNIPEGLAVGFAFGAALAAKENAFVLSALALAIGIGIQNFPEGAAISLPMKAATGSKKKAFLYGSFSGIVEPIFAVVGLFLAMQLSALMPWLLSFAAGAMIFVVAEDIIPDSQSGGGSHLATWGLMVGFALMMVLDVVLG